MAFRDRPTQERMRGYAERRRRAVVNVAPRWVWWLDVFLRLDDTLRGPESGPRTMPRRLF